MATIEELEAQVVALTKERDVAKAELSEAWLATGVASTVRGLTTLADVVATNKQHLLEALHELDSVKAREARPCSSAARLRELWVRFQSLADECAGNSDNRFEMAFMTLEQEVREALAAPVVCE